ncbi:MAG: hypothetical protein ACKOEW_06390 [Methylocystis sp.]
MANTPIPATSVEPIAQTQDIFVPMAWVWSQYQGQIIHAENAASDQSLTQEKRVGSLDQKPNSRTLNSDQARGIADNIKNIVKKNEEKKRSQRKSWPKSFGVGAIVALGSAMALVIVVSSQMTQESHKQISLHTDAALSGPIAFNDISIAKQKLASSVTSQQGVLTPGTEKALMVGRGPKIEGGMSNAPAPIQQEVKNTALIAPKAKPDEAQGSEPPRSAPDASKTERTTEFIQTAIVKLQESNKYGAHPETQVVVQSLSKLLTQDKLASKPISYSDTTGSIAKSKKTFVNNELSLFSIPLAVLLLSIILFFQSRRDKMGLDALRLNNVEFDQLLRGIESSVANFNVTDDEILKQRQTARALFQKHTRKNGILSWLGLK